MAKKKNFENRMMELRAIQKLKHENIVRTKQVFFSAESIISVSEFCEYCDLKWQMEQRVNYFMSQNQQIPAFPEEIVRMCLVQITRALTYHHDRGWIHLNVSPSTIFITKNGKFKLNDYDYSMMVADDQIMDV